MRATDPSTLPIGGDAKSDGIGEAICIDSKIVVDGGLEAGTRPNGPAHADAGRVWWKIRSPNLEAGIRGGTSEVRVDRSVAI